MRIPARRTEARRDRPRGCGRRRRRGWVVALAALTLAGCGGDGTEARAPIARETPKDQILRIAREWAGESDERGFRSPPSRIRMFTRRTESRLSFASDADRATETLTVEETFELADGTKIQCQTPVSAPVVARFGDHAGESAVEVRRSPVRVPRVCATPGLPEPMLELEATAARYALRGDRLIPFAPATERRQYIPAP